MKHILFILGIILACGSCSLAAPQKNITEFLKEAITQTITNEDSFFELVNHTEKKQEEALQKMHESIVATQELLAQDLPDPEKLNQLRIELINLLLQEKNDEQRKVIKEIIEDLNLCQNQLLQN
jgi:disulfide oxidoreductase YuzD